MTVVLSDEDISQTSQKIVTYCNYFVALWRTIITLMMFFKLYITMKSNMDESALEYGILRSVGLT